MRVQNIPLNKIYCDSNFNCRGAVNAIDVMELAKDISGRGMLQPIIIQPLEGREKEGYEYQIVCGFRRFKAHEILELTGIDCVVGESLSPTDALLFNLSENIHRKDLNILQEAKTIERLKRQGLAYKEVAEKLNKSVAWVDIRFRLLDLPEEIQEQVASGLIKQNQIRALSNLESKKSQLQAASDLKDAAERGDKISDMAPMGKRNLKKTRKRNSGEILWMADHIAEAIGYRFGTRCLAWARGDIADIDLFKDIKTIADAEEKEYKVPYELSK